MRDAPLTVLKGGINRNRTKGNARADHLYDLVNAYLTSEGTAKSRPGTIRDAELPSTTKGLCAFQSLLHVFSHQSESVPDGYVNHILEHPDNTPELTHTLTKIHFAKPFLGFLYVAAEFDDGQVFHFWLQSDGAWEANKTYQIGDVTEPTTANGLTYRATRMGGANPLWSARSPRQIGDRVEPTAANGFYYEIVAVVGANPASGDVEPNWPTEEGAQISEDTEGVAGGSSAVPTNPGSRPSSGITDRYGDGQLDRR